MRTITVTIGASLGLLFAAAGTAHADCQQSEFCRDGLCRPVLACGNVEATTAPPAKAAAPVPKPAPQPTAARELRQGMGERRSRH